MKINHDILRQRSDRAKKHKFPIPKWVLFCKAMLEAGYTLHMYEAKTTVSKYITVSRGAKQYRVRFSNHKPSRFREFAGDCDFFVGITHTGVRTWEDAIKATKAYLDDESMDASTVD